MTNTKISCRELRQLLNDYTGGQLFNKSVSEMKKYIKHNFNCSRYAVDTLANEFAGK